MAKGQKKLLVHLNDQKNELAVIFPFLISHFEQSEKTLHSVQGAALHTAPGSDTS